MSPSISVIVPLYNAEQYISVCVGSILRQTFSDFELLLVDDGSKDCSSQKCNALALSDNRIHVFHQNNAGVSAARNLGIENAKGKYIAFVDADDIVSADYLSYLLEGINKENTVLSMCSHVRIRDYNYQFSAAQDVYIDIPAKESSKRLLNGDFPVSVCGGLLKKELLKDISFPVGIRNNEDKLFLYQYLINNEEGSVSFSNEKLYGYYVREGSATTASWNGSFDIITIADEIFNITQKVHPEWIETAKNACMKSRLDTLKSIILSNKAKQFDSVVRNLHREILEYGYPSKGGHRLKLEYTTLRMGIPAYNFLVKSYYRMYSEEARYKMNDKRTRQ